MNNSGVLVKSGFSHLATAIYYPLDGQEKEFLALWKEGPLALSEKHGGVHIGIYYNAKRKEFIATSHWHNKEAFTKYSNSAILSKWMEKINLLSKRPAFRDLYTIIEEAA